MLGSMPCALVLDGQHHRLPVGVERRLVSLALDRPEALHAPQIVPPFYAVILSTGFRS